MYLNVAKLARQAGVEIPEDLLLEIEAANRSEQLRYDKVVSLKERVLRMVFEEEQYNFRDDYNWFSFFDLNRDWLVPYAVFCFLRDSTASADYSKWGEYAVYDEGKVAELASPARQASTMTLKAGRFWRRLG